MSGQTRAERVDLAPDTNRAPLRWLPAGGALLVLALLAGITFGGAPAQAAFPGINGKLFCQEASPAGVPATKDQDIFSINPDGTGRALVTDNTLIDPLNPASFLQDRDANVSPDGKKVVFSSNRDGPLSLYIKNVDGTGPETRLTDATGSFGDISSHWSPDGTMIYFTRNFPGGNAEIYRINADGSNPTNLTNRASQEVNPSVSPDGRKILFHSNRNFAPVSTGDQDIYSMDPDGSNVQDITNDSNPDRNDLYPNWSPDGTQFVFERATTNFASSNIYKMNANGTGLTQLTFTASGLNRFPVWSPDGTRISFDSERDNLPAPEPRNREVYTMKTDGSDVRRVTNAPGSDSQCDWQTIPRPAPRPPVVPPPAYPVPVPTAAKLKTSLTLKARPKRDRRLPFRYRFSGKVRIPAGVSKPAVCSGRVRLRLTKGAKTVATSTAKVSRSCTYTKRLTIRTTKRTGTRRGKLKATARFGGNARLKSSRKSTTVRFF